MADNFIGEIRPIAFNYPPRFWAFCSGQLLPIAQNQALFSLLGTTYGGNGQTTFALPDLRGRVPISSGTGFGLSPYFLGERAGENAITLAASQMPAHSHAVATSNAADSPSPEGNVPAQHSGHHLYSPTAGATFAPDTVGSVGGTQPHPNQQPSIGINYIIALSGIFPSRD
jgi:microcystin-dependent protein